MVSFIGKRKILGLAVIGFMALPGLSACSLDTETAINQKHIELHNDIYNETFPTGSLTPDMLLAMSDDYERYGEGPLEIVITYDPKSKKNTAMKAADAVAKLASDMQKAGIRNVNTDLMPVEGSGEESQTMIGYLTVTAQEPEGCQFMGGVDGETTKINADYEYGCTTEMLLARQIYRPKDLRGNDARPDAYARRRGNVTYPYSFGVPNQPLEGYSASNQ
ncbi:MAG: hypothetical protein H6868_09890 [Rhodospirillales bacterium]|nr:hypothetical protein [Rhodospirillales bacterium]